MEGGSLVIQGQAEAPGTLPRYTSGRVRSFGRFSVAPGAQFPVVRIEARMKLPDPGAGVWPAFWMLPSEGATDGCSGCGRYGNWAASGEIDIMEASGAMTTVRRGPGWWREEGLAGVVQLVFGSQADPAEHIFQSPASHSHPSAPFPPQVDGTIHFGGSWPYHTSLTHASELPGRAPFSDAFHTFGLEWEREEMRWYLDGDLQRTARSANATRDGWFSFGPGAGPTSPFDVEFHLLLNLALGGGYTYASAGEVAAAMAAGPRRLLVDWVRVTGRN